ncbi:MAG: hypothetical protein Q8P90_06350 [bacterium]|nr:hypothetical protein [bacterium]
MTAKRIPVKVINESVEETANFQDQRIHKKFLPLVIIFSAIGFLIVCLVFYTAFGKTTITIKTTPISESEEYIYSADEVDGIVESIEFKHDYEFTNFSNSEPENVPSTGRVTIYNKYSADQPLVETTRLLSEEGVLFRTADTVTVPSGGEVEVDVYADEAGPGGNIGPSTFEIVALWEGLKDKIYAESTTGMSSGLANNTVVEQEHLTLAREEAEQKIRLDALSEIQEKVQTEASGLTQDSLMVEIVEQSVSPAVGTETGVITVSTMANVSALGFDKDKLVNLIEEESMGVVKPEKVSYNLEFDESNNMIVKAQASVAKRNDELDFIDKSKLTNKTEAEINEYLESFDEITSMAVHFSPFWLNRTSVREEDITLKVSES